MVVEIMAKIDLTGNPNMTFSCRWLLRALELYREMTLTDPQPIHTLSPHSVRKLLYTVLSESRAIDLGFQPLKTECDSATAGKINLLIASS